MAPITLGRKAVVSQDVDLVAGSHDYTRIDLQPLLPLIVKPIVVGNHCWICARSFLLPGVVIGEGSVIGACSVVTRDQPPWMVCAGNPCRPLKPRTQPSYDQT
jgi:putative colanic acid biosynthesis acetyltransferase WcaF